MLWLPGRGEGQGLGAEGSRLERGARRASEKARPRRGVDGVGQGVGQGGRGRRVAETVAPRRLPGVAEEVGGEDDRLDRAEQEDELMDYERTCASGEALVYSCDDPPHDEAAHPCLRT